MKTIEMTERELLNVTLPILHGLLASGHYTNPKEETYGIEGSQVIRDLEITGFMGDKWRSVYANRHPAEAVRESIGLAFELMKQIKIDFEYIEEEFYDGLPNNEQ